MIDNQKQLSIKLPMWDELPSFDLHLDQLLDLTNQYLSPIIGSKITKTMMHNYFKADIIVPPNAKKNIGGCNWLARLCWLVEEYFYPR